MPPFGTVTSDSSIGARFVSAAAVAANIAVAASVATIRPHFAKDLLMSSLCRFSMDEYYSTLRGDLTHKREIIHIYPWRYPCVFGIIPPPIQEDIWLEEEENDRNLKRHYQQMRRS